MKKRFTTILQKFVPLFFLLILSGSVLQAQHSVARQWNEVLLESIRDDFARPTVHARNLWHTSVAMYDAWSIYDNTAQTYLLGKTVDGYTCSFEGFSPIPEDIQAAREEAISYACYRLLHHRFQDTPAGLITLERYDDLMSDLGYDINFTSTEYQNGSPAALGNYIGQCLIDFGLQDGSNEQFGYENLFYSPVNDPIDPTIPGNSTMSDPNRWQPISFETFVDQSGNVIPLNVPDFLSPEWGQVVPFALNEEDANVYTRDGFDYWVYHDPGPPPYFQDDQGGLTSEYKWGHLLVAVWSNHLDPTDGVMWDISPGSIGNVPELPTNFSDFRNFYDLENGGDPSLGHATNPVTGEAYPEQVVPRGDYTRILAEFWADGPDSETPPGHWFVILNYVNDHPQLEKKFKGEGEVLADLEWDVKTYFTLGGAMHDAAISAWGIKGYYDYTRPLSAIRWMADQGQETDPALPNYDPKGIPLVPGIVEVVQSGDPLAGVSDENVGKIKINGWRGHDFIEDPETDTAGVGWILAENWWPYQRPTFITPPFAGYVSGHSTYSRAAAEILTLLTGDAYFPGGVGEFFCSQNEFLVFEDGPSVDITLQWATYRDASDQTSLSRIWGGIHPPADDIPGRIIGIEIGHDAFALAEQYFAGEVTNVADEEPEQPLAILPNPVRAGGWVSLHLPGAAEAMEMRLVNPLGQVVTQEIWDHGAHRGFYAPQKPGVYFLNVRGVRTRLAAKLVVSGN